MRLRVALSRRRILFSLLWDNLSQSKYAKYRAAQQEMWKAVVVKTNIDHLLDVTDGRRNRE